MWNYEKRLQYPVNISTPNPKIAQVILTQFGGPDGELSASMRYLAQRYSMPFREVAGLLTDIGTKAPEMFQKRHQITKPFHLCFNSCAAPFKWEQFQIHINMVFVIYDHFI